MIVGVFGVVVMVAMVAVVVMVLMVVTDLFPLVRQDARRGEVNESRDEGDLAEQVCECQVTIRYTAIAQWL